MKKVSDLVKDFIPSEGPQEFELMLVMGGVKEFDEPLMSDAVSCPACGETRHIVPFMNPAGGKRIRICIEPHCMTCDRSNWLPRTIPVGGSVRAIPWGLWCEINDVGDVYADLKFEMIEQSPGKIEYLHKFGKKPHGIIFMEGAPGLGKTYAALATCELFTRNSPFAIFLTQSTLAQKWMDRDKGDVAYQFISSLTKVPLLVIDDFGTSEIPAGFMTFFMNLINSRMQWTDKGTIISTNLLIEKFTAFCGEALSDRIMTGQHFHFSGESRRNKKPI